MRCETPPPVSPLATKTAHFAREKCGRLLTLAEREVGYFRCVLDLNGQYLARAAKVLGIDRVSLPGKLKKYGMAENNQTR